MMTIFSCSLMIHPTFPPALRGDDAPNSGDAEGLPLPVSILADGPLAAMAETGPGKEQGVSTGDENQYFKPTYEGTPAT